MQQINQFSTAFTNIIKASELPVEWASQFTNPEQLVVVTICDSQTHDSQTKPYLTTGHSLDGRINLAAPNKIDRQTLSSMRLSTQKQLYETAILSASAQQGRSFSLKDIKRAALQLA